MASHMSTVNSSLPSIQGASVGSVARWRIGRWAYFFSKRRGRILAATRIRPTSMAWSCPGFRRTLRLRQQGIPSSGGATSTGSTIPA